MKSDLEMLKERIEIYLRDKTSREEAVRFLRNAGVKFSDLSKEYGYTNLRFYAEGGYVRAFQTRKMNGFKVQIFRNVEMKYSGIPVFEPSGRRSF